MLKLFKILPKAIIQNSFICKKIYITTILVILSSFCSVAQTISPSEGDPYCPGQDIIFTVSLPVEVSGFPTVMPKSTTGPMPTITVYPYDFVFFSSSTTFKFKAKFWDQNNTQIFQVRYTPKGSSSESTKEFVYKKIKSLKTTTTMYPNRYTIDVERCKQSTFNIHFDNLKYVNFFEIPAIIEFGDINQYEYLLPKDWKLNGIPSDGSSWMKADNSVSITSDPSHGDKESIQIRAVNGCDPTGFLLAKGQIKNIPISRPEPTLNITPYTTNICSGSKDVEIKGIPLGASVVWSVSDPSEASVTASPANTSIATVTRTGSADVNLTLKATVTYCSYTSTATGRIILGSPKPIEIVGMGGAPLYDGQYLTIYVREEAENYNWSVAGGKIIGSSTGNIIKAKLDKCRPHQTASNAFTATVSYENACGVSPKKIETAYADCYGFETPEEDFDVIISPNPAKDNLYVKINDGEEHARFLSKEINAYYKLYDLYSSKLVKEWSFKNSQNQNNLNIADVKPGQYVLVVTKGKFRQSKQVIIE